ncbi:MAG: flagellar protein FlgN [SAR324 cluster bacterium]|nr:flagellar protein FlgN [SAR324 cluster bacterium]MBL7036039.1 flagellar protein FlgN [SAR324 cluster bacterium]
MNDLLNILRQEVELHEQLISLLQTESEGFGHLRGSELLKLQGEKSRCVRATSRLERERILLVEKLADTWEVEPQELTLKVIISRAETVYSEPLQECYDRLKTLLIEIRKVADKNSLQAAGRLKSVESSIQFMSQLQSGPPTYSDAGKIQKGTSITPRTEA